MDPPLISEGSFSTTNPSLAEIWPFVNGHGHGNGGGDNNGLLGLRMGSGNFGSGLIDALMNSHNNNNNNINVNGGVGVVNRDGSNEESTVTEQSGSLGVGRKRRDFNSNNNNNNNINSNLSEDEDSKLVSTTSSGNDLKESNSKRMKTSDAKDENGSSKAGGETSSAGGNKSTEKTAEPLKDYIHVRARRGQATDSHSLAERARREKISERMKILQDLVPGCNKVIGKALVLDEIINYIQSLQRQVEFLSMKLEAVNSGMVPSVNGFHSKDVNQLGVPSFDPSGMMFNAQAAREFVAAASAAIGPQSEWLHMQLGGSFERT